MVHDNDEFPSETGMFFAGPGNEVHVGMTKCKVTYMFVYIAILRQVYNIFAIFVMSRI